MTLKFSNKIYDNCAMYGPEGQLMSYVCKKAAQWYLDRDLAVKLQDEPLHIKLNFIPKHLGHAKNEFYLTPKENICVVCGLKEQRLTRHHVVPRCYRRFFSEHEVQGNSHDIVPLCVECHESYELKAIKLKKELTKKHNVHIIPKKEEYTKIILRATGSASAILRYGDQIPEKKIQELWKNIEKFTGNKRKYLTEDLLENLVMHGRRIQSHLSGKRRHSRVVEALGTNTVEKMWRTHFLKYAEPKFMPEGWSVDHTVRKKCQEP